MIIFLLIIIILGAIVIKVYGQGTCSAKFDTGTEVTLTAKPCPNYSFVKWTGDCSTYGKNKTCKVIMNGDKTVGAVFLPKPKNIRISKSLWSEKEIKYCSAGQEGFYQ